MKQEPTRFDATVRKPGLAWLKRHAIALNKPLPAKSKIRPYWRECLDDLHASYDGVCAYLCVFIERCTGGVSVDHFVAKSSQANLAYEWSNYRLACVTMNARKRDFSTILDPFAVVTGTFRLEFVTGRIFPTPGHSRMLIKDAQQTIDYLGLDDDGCREMRARHYEGYRRRDYSANFLRRHSPFVWAEADRQGLL